ncbi:3-hydroxyacyl-CoA dehydrogenase [Arthrobacter subterraneus]|uniref:3-hydroxyacyl-CoA dehydrogenase n=1 Tax=Arthrobacter subterraneus TaxID=335973 RepID=A0A1G8C9U3_9MICC|nr:3-hydroxyacyl-CoA dehydrogenase family protein [Arthrobacter subterraneus]SDH42079.1 3-hydroxyacyl-CoA dehydrogenase [Arthrobacter subterraneus]
MTVQINSAAIIGGGYMGGGMAQSLALSGVCCKIADIDAEAARKSVDRLVEEGRRYEGEGLFPSGAGELLESNLRAAHSLADAVDDVDYVAEVVPERLELKQSVIGQISAAAKSGTIIGSNTSAIPISTLAESSAEPENFLGVHWMNPSYFVPSVEIIPTVSTSAGAVEAVEKLLGRAGKVATQVSDSAGFVANRLQFALYQEAVRMVEEGLADPAQIDEVVSNSFGFRLAVFGPFAIADIAGLDVYEGAFRSMEAAYGERFAAPSLLREKVAAGQLGMKSGQGFLAMDPAQAGGLAKYRDRAYAELGALKQRLGNPPID